MTEKDEKRPTIKVVDRRSFTSDGRRREAPAGAPGGEEEPAGGAGTGEGRGEPPRVHQGEGFTMETPPQEGTAYVAADAAFVNHCISLYQVACLSLGLVAEREDAKPEVNLDAARAMIDTLSMLKEKTRGNLSDEERRVLESLLAELQMTYVMKTKAPGA